MLVICEGESGVVVSNAGAKPEICKIRCDPVREHRAKGACVVAAPTAPHEGRVERPAAFAVGRSRESEQRPVPVRQRRSRRKEKHAQSDKQNRVPEGSASHDRYLCAAF